MAAPQKVRDLIDLFERNADAYRAVAFNETNTRQQFINPLFKCLGWDMDNEQGYAEAYKDVIHEDAIKVEGATKAPDYCFRIGGTRKFFLEAKKPAVNLKNDPDPAYQLRRYGWTAKMPLSVLTDFEEFAVYDCRVKPDKTDKAAVARIKYYTFREYAEHWDEIAEVFSKDAILKGSFDKYAETARGKKGTTPVDTAFLQEIEGWRELLAKNIALRNTALGTRELNFAVQATIDRLIFLRMCEDRGIEPYGQLQKLLDEPGIYPHLVKLYRMADDRYNSGLFYFHKEKDRDEAPDTLTPNLAIDDKPLKDIIRHLYYPDCPYEFSVLSGEILGQVYEQFLGKVIRLTAGHRAQVDDKPEVKKAGGVYYTPNYIVKYIVEHTVGKMLESRESRVESPEPEGNPTLPALRSRLSTLRSLRILDPACGSGSFLLEAYQYLLDWNLRRYTDPARAKANKQVFQTPTGAWRLTTAEKKRILLDHIFGVDIDPQAVEVTKLSLMLKVLEGENEQSLAQQRSLFHERALPDLSSNIKCGNSLIGPDFYAGRQTEMFDEEERYRINVFDWQAEFPKIMKAGGFDAVIGNPPYGAFIGKNEGSYLREKFETSTSDLDSYTMFMEDAIKLCKPLGRVSMIVPTGWYSGARFGLLRRFVASVTDPECFVNLPYDVFAAWVDTTIFVASVRSNRLPWPRPTLPAALVRLRTFPKRHRISTVAEFETGGDSVNFGDWFATGSDEYLTYADAAATTVLRKVQERGKPLSSVADIQRGVTPFQLTDKPMHKTSRPAFSGTVRRYRLEMGERKFIRFDQTLAEPKPERYFQGPRLLLRELISRQFQLQAVKATEDFVTNKSMQSILQLPGAPDLGYLLGFLNSKLLSWYFLHVSNIAQRDDFPKIVLKETRLLPIRPIDFSNPADRSRHDRVVSLVETMLALHRQLAAVKTGHERTALQRQIDATDGEIDRLVYELYGLTAEEIKIVEGATGG